MTSSTAACILVAAIFAVPTIAPVATRAGPQAQTITVLQRMVDLQQQPITILQAQVAQLQLEVTSLTRIPSDSKSWAPERTLDEKSASSSPPARLNPATSETSASSGTVGRSCRVLYGPAVPSGQTIRACCPPDSVACLRS